MKVYLMDPKNKFFKIKKYLNQRGIENVEKREKEKIRMTKNDFLILADSEEIANLEKYKNSIILLKIENQKQIWELAKKENVLDLMKEDIELDKIGERIYEQILAQRQKEEVEE